MRVLINALKLDSGGKEKLSGNFYHVYWLVKALIKLPDIDIYLLVDSISGFYFSQIMNSSNLIFIELKIKYKFFFLDNTINTIIKKYKIDIYHCPAGQLPLFKKLNCKTISTISDIDHFTSLKKSRIKKLYKIISYRRTLKQADFLTFISNYSYEQVRKYFGYNKNNFQIVHLGTNDLGKPTEKIIKDIDGEFWLSFGHFPHKNVKTAILALKKFNSDNNLNHKLVIIGAGNYFDKSINPLITKNFLASNIIIYLKVTDSELHALYKNAQGLLFLSLHEGFGLPVVEGFKYSCPVITSNTTSIPEVGGDAAIYVDPLDVNMIVKKMYSVVFYKNFREDTLQRGKKRALEFTWELAASKTRDIYLSLLH